MAMLLDRGEPLAFLGSLAGGPGILAAYQEREASSGDNELDAFHFRVVSNKSFNAASLSRRTGLIQETPDEV